MMTVDLTKNTKYMKWKRDMFGDFTMQQWARDALPILIERAQVRETINFKELQQAIGSKTSRLGGACDLISTTLYKLEHGCFEYHWERGRIPRLTNIVIKTNGKPSPWVAERITGDPNCYFEKYVRPVFDYQYWDDVLEALRKNG